MDTVPTTANGCEGTNTWWMGQLFNDADVDMAMSRIATVRPLGSESELPCLTITSDRSQNYENLGIRSRDYPSGRLLVRLHSNEDLNHHRATKEQYTTKS